MRQIVLDEKKKSGNSPSRIDGIVFCIDNYGDLGIAISELFREKEEYELLHKKSCSIRLFTDEKNTALQFLEASEKQQIEICCFSEEFCEYAEKLILFFDAKIPEILLSYKSDFKREIFVRSYLQFDPKTIQSLHGTSYFDSSLQSQITYEVLTLGEGGRCLDIPRMWFHSKYETRQYWGERLQVKQDLNWFGIFCYPQRQEKILQMLEREKFDGICFLFGSQIPVKGKYCFQIVILPFLPIIQFIGILSCLNGGIVRGEHSLGIAHRKSIPYAWDIYREDNKAHEEKYRIFSLLIKKKNHLEKFQEILNEDF